MTSVQFWRGRDARYKMLGVIQGVKLAPEMGRGNWRLECVWGAGPKNGWEART